MFYILNSNFLSILDDPLYPRQNAPSGIVAFFSDELGLLKSIFFGLGALTIIYPYLPTFSFDVKFPETSRSLKSIEDKALANVMNYIEEFSKKYL